MASEERKRSNSHDGLWLVVLLLLIFTIATSALLASILKGISKGEQNVIALFPSKSIEAISTEVDYVPAKLDPELEASDGKVSWETSTDIDLFKNAYQNANGETTVESGNGEKVIAPGTTNSYRFSLKNTGNVSLTYTLKLEGVFKLSDEQLPFEVRLSKGNEWIVGTEQKWGTLEKLNTVEERDELGVGKYVTYTLEWQWPFENDEADQKVLQDLNDTIMGNEAVTEKADFELSIYTFSEAAPGAVAEDEQGAPLYDEVISHKTVTYIGTPLLAMIGTGLILLLLLLRRKRIYVTGFIPEMAGCKIQCGGKQDIIRQDGRFVFEKTAMGNHTFTVKINETEQTDISWGLRTKKDLEGLEYTWEDGKLQIHISRKIRAVELYLHCTENQIVVDEKQWAAIDKDNIVYTINGTKKPDEHKRNQAPSGLKVDEKHRFSFKDEV